jgi:DNA repair protein SbcC/Rad50
MKPLKLKMQAFGPYASVEVIDFTSLGNRTMFVISGKTGAGKTTIFDAISYAIYGKASGEDRNGPELRSQFSSDDVETEVSLEFSLRNKMYHIIRSPQQERKKKSGEGVTTIGAKAELYAWNENGEKVLIASKVSEVEEKIKEIMLIDSNQFKQILMIPQGEFRKLLTSDSKDKEVILQRLFHTQIYKMVEEKLKIEATELKKTVENQVQARSEAIRRIQAITNEELKSYLEAGSTNDMLILPLLREEIESMSVSLDKMTLEVDEKKVDRDKLIQLHVEAKAIVNQFSAMEELRTIKENLEAQTSDFTKKENDVRLAQKANILAKQEELCHRLSHDLKDAQLDFDNGKRNVEELTKLMEQRNAELEAEKARESKRQEIADDCIRLDNMKEDVYSYATSKKEATATKELLDAKKLKLVVAEKDLVRAEESIKTLQNQKSSIEKGQLTYTENERLADQLQIEWEKLGKYANALQRLKTTTSEEQVGQTLFEKEFARYQDARDLVDDLEQKWMHGQAAILAGRLQSGEACPVCGSEHHPVPSSGSGAIVPNEEDLKAAKLQATKLEQEKSKAESSLFKLQSQKQGAERDVNTYFLEIKTRRLEFQEKDLETIKMEVSAEKERINQVQKNLSLLIKSLDLVDAQLAQSEIDKEEIRKAIVSYGGEITDLTVKYTQQETQLNRMTSRIPDNLRSVSAFNIAVKDALANHERLKKELEIAQQNYVDTKERQSSATARIDELQKLVLNRQSTLETERGIFKTSMVEQGFETYREYEQAKKTEVEIDQLEAEIRSYREQFRSVSDQYEKLSQLLRNVTYPDLQNLEIKIQVLTDELKVLDENQRDLFMKKRDNQELLTKIEQINDEMQVLENRYKLVGHLYEISKGQNNLRITFERFVLASFLDDILREANVRLVKMTSGRYQLLRKTDRAKGSAQSGLELLVYDQYTGQERHVKTLSGGESFKAALALALGLADVVQNYAGGVSLETMFIDEGFGTLDPESLDQAIESLIDIQSSGRLVGIISHVPELKERIDARLEVIAEQTGSRTEFVFTN